MITISRRDTTAVAAGGEGAEAHAAAKGGVLRRREVLRTLGVGLIAALVWVAYFQRWSAEAWNTPTDYYIDAHETLARLKAASEGELRPLQSQVLDRLGAPFGADWNEYPAPDKPLMIVLGVLVNLVGLFAAANIGFVLAQVLSAVTFYLVARWLRCRWEWAAAGALLFAYTYHTFHRGLSHLSLVFIWTVPLGLLAVWWVARSRRLAWGRPGAWLCLGAGVALGIANPYNLYFWLQLMAWALVIQWFGRRRWANVQIGLATVAVAVLAFVAVHAETWLFVQDPDGVPLLARNYAGTEMYALKPVEMFIPPTFHAWDWLAFFGNRYTRWSGWRGEAFLPYLGLVGIAGFAWLVASTVRRIIQQRALPGQALSVGWILGYASIGGLTNLLALFAGFQIFRATNRAAIFISALVLLFLVVRLSRCSVRWPAAVRWAAAALVAAFGVLEQLPRRSSVAERDAIVRAVENDRELGRTLEHELPGGAMVFQLPVVGFPEAATPHRLNDYEHFRPFLATETLRFSYGAPKTRARGRWQRELEGRPTTEVVERLEDFGFAAIYLNRKGYEDGGERVLRELRELGYSETWTDRDNEQVVVKLRPAGAPVPPLAERLTFGQGWHLKADAGVRWAYEEAALSYFNPHGQSIVVELELTLVAATEREVTFVQEDEEGEVRRFRVGTTAQTVKIPRVTLAPGVNRFAIDSETPAVRQSGGAYGLRSFGVAKAAVHATASVRSLKSVPGRPALAARGD